MQREKISTPIYIQRDNMTKKVKYVSIKLFTAKNAGILSVLDMILHTKNWSEVA